MAGLQRPTPDVQIIDLTRRLAEDYDSIPLPEVSRVVRDAAVVATGPDRWAGTPAGLPALLDVIEHVAREDLEEVRLQHERVSRRRPAGSAPRAASRPRSRRDAE